MTALAKEAARRIGRKIHFGVATTGYRYMEPIHPDALCIDMETAAVSHACYLNRIPFIAVRSISGNDKEAGQEAINRNYDKATKAITAASRILSRPKIKRLFSFMVIFTPILYVWTACCRPCKRRTVKKTPPG